jgi:hypothetical protein
MAYRKFDTGTWQDPWFEGLGSKAKLAFIYLWTNDVTNAAGIYELSERRIKFELGYGIDTIYSELKDRVVWYPEKNIVWVKNFFRRQCQNYKFAISALSAIKNDPFKLSIFIQYNQELLESFTNKDGGKIIDLSAYHTDTIQIPYPTEQNREEQNKTDTEAEAEACGGGVLKTPLKEIIKSWNDAISKNKSIMPQVISVNPDTGRYTHLRARWKENPDLEIWKTVFEKASASDFMNGRARGRDRPFSFDWVIQSAGNFTKVLEGKYDNAVERSAGHGNGSGNNPGGAPSKYDQIPERVVNV